jgi:hypothetical protein
LRAGRSVRDSAALAPDWVGDWEGSEGGCGRRGRECEWDGGERACCGEDPTDMNGGACAIEFELGGPLEGSTNSWCWWWEEGENDHSSAPSCGCCFTILCPEILAAPPYICGPDPGGAALNEEWRMLLSSYLIKGLEEESWPGVEEGRIIPDGELVVQESLWASMYPPFAWWLCDRLDPER